MLVVNKQLIHFLLLSDVMPQGAIKFILDCCTLGMDRALAVRGRELEDYQFYDTDLRYGLDRALKSSRGRRSRRKAIISSLIRILLDPVSPAESEEEPEM